MKKNEMDGSCDTYETQERCVQDVWWKDLMETDSFQGIGVDRRIILKDILKKWDGKSWAALLWLRTVTGGGLL